MQDKEKAAPDFLTVSEVSALLRVTPQAVRDMIRRGDLKAIKPGRQFRIPRTEIDRITALPETDATGKP